MPVIYGLIAVLLVMGIITGILDVAMQSQAVMVEQQYKNPIMTSFHAVLSIGIGTGHWCGALLADLGYDLSIHFTAIVILGLMAALWASKNLIHDKPDTNKHEDGPLFRLPTPAMVSIGIIAFCCMMGEGAMGDWSVNYMENF